MRTDQVFHGFASAFGVFQFDQAIGNGQHRFWCSCRTYRLKKCCWCYNKLKSKANEFAKGDKVSFDWDETLSTPRGLELAQTENANESTLYIISARQDITQSMLDRAKQLGILESRIYATGSNKAKVEKINELGRRERTK